ncbi:hypothetical protein DL765_009939 [Monosporascus sp. GIB2]|nr:hypothetical protein DL765_009939 [Monosporascus sp. GIB2]
MALFCARYLTSLPFALGLSGSEIRRHAITGYYGFQDYAAALWWKHAYRVINTATDIDTDLYNKMLQAVARAMEAYSNPSNSLPGPGRRPTDAVQHRLQELAEDAHEWENNFKVEFRTRAIRNTIEYLLERGAKVNFQGGRGHKRTALHAAALADDVELTYLLLSQPKATPRLKDSEKLTAAGTAAKNGCNNALSVFISRGLASKPSQDGAGNTCLSIAMNSGNLNTAELLINDTSFDLNGYYGGKAHPNLPLHIATKTGLVEIVKLLLSSGRVDVNKADLSGRQALHYACGNGHDSIVELLLPVTDDHDVRDDRGTTPFHYAAKKGHAAVSNLLLERGKVDANSKDSFGRTPLLYAAKKGYEVIVKLLFEKGANIELRDNNGSTPLWNAITNRHEGIWLDAAYICR